jgi:hypothetical protein
MDKTLNDKVEELFRGIVFILFSFTASLALLLWRPLRGYVGLIKRSRVRSSGQIRPYAFLFFSFVLMFFIPTIVDALTPPGAGPFDYQVHDSEFPELGALGRAYQATTERLETKAATAILLAAVVGVATFHLGAVGSALVLTPLRVRRETWRDALFFIGGLQLGLLALAFVVDLSEVYGSTEFGFINKFLLTPRNLFGSSSHPRPYPIYMDMLHVGLLALLLLAPFGIALRYAPRLALRLALRWPKPHRVDWIGVLLLMIIADVVALVSFGLAAFTSDQVQPRDKPTYPFAMRYLNCAYEEKSGKRTITGSVEIRAAANDPWGFAASDFDLIVSADRIESDRRPTRPQASRVVGTGRIIEHSRMPVLFSAISPNLGSPPFLLQAGQAALVRFETETTDAVTAFLAAHPDEHRCVLSYTSDYPVGAIGSLRSPSETSHEQ